MKKKFYPGDTAVINGAHITVDATVTLTVDGPVHRIPTPGVVDLPETDVRIQHIWPNRFAELRFRRRLSVPQLAKIQPRPSQEYRCPCGSAYTRKSEEYISCTYCTRTWKTKEIDE